MSKHRMIDISNSIGWKEFNPHLERFMKINNFKDEEIKVAYHMLNSFYMLGYPIEKVCDE